MSPFEVEAKHIEFLNTIQLTKLLRRLLYLEAGAYMIPFSAPHVPLEINVPDGGEDGRIKWEGSVDRTDFLPKRFVLFQMKAKEMDPADCYNEVLKNECKILKDQVAQVLDSNGAYIVFCKKSYVGKQIDERIEKVREALKKAGRKDFESAHIEFFDGSKIAAWVNKYFAAQIDVRSCTGQNIPWGLKTWENWAGHEDYKLKYVTNENLQGYIKDMRKYFVLTENPVARLTGLSGLGKTRFALEVFRCENGEDIQIEILQKNVIYFDASFGADGLINFIADSRNENLKVLFVVDNCEYALHERLQKEMGYNKKHMGLLTIDFSSEEKNPSYRCIRLTQEDCKGVVKSLLQEVYPGLKTPIVERVIEFAQDFPSIAVLLAKQVQRGVEDIGRISDEGIVKRLLWGRGDKDNDIVSIIKACSLFEYVEFSDEQHGDNVKFLASEVANVHVGKFYEICSNYVKRGILQKRGRFIRVCPAPLAITLAAEWWDSRPTEELVKFIGKVEKANLLPQFCEQAKKLHFSKNARVVVEKLCGPQGPFGNPEVLLSDEGSRLFLSLVEVNPQATINVLWKVLADKSRDELLNIKNNIRRNLVWALERICWWEDTFGQGARLLLKLAAAENENWSNNATGLFLQLFHIYLSGTQANLNDRLLIVREALASQMKEEQELGIRAIGRAIETHSFSRMGGVESQGSRVPGRDYAPTSQEVQKYWQECIRLLKDKILLGGEMAKKAKHELGTNVGSLIRHGMIKEVEETIEAITSQGDSSWAECLTSVRRLLDFHTKDMPADVRDHILHLESLLQPKNLREQLRLIISIPDWRDKKDEKGDYVSIAAEEADKLGRQLASDNSWFKEVDVILKGEQRQAYAFGKALGQSMPAEQQREFIEICLKILAKLGYGNGNPDVLGAFLGSVSDESLVEETMERVVQDEKLWSYAVYLTRFLKITEKQLLRLMPLVSQNKIPISDIRVFSYGGVLKKLSEDFITRFCQTIANHSREGANCALDLLCMFGYQDDERFVKCAPTFRNIIMLENLLIEEKQSQMSGHNWEVVSKKMLMGRKDVELAKHLAKEIVRMCDSDKISWEIVHYNAKKVLEILLKEYFDTCWSIIGEALISKKWGAKYCLGSILGLEDEKEEGKSLIAELDEAGLLEWCKNNIPKGPASIAHFTPMFSGDKEKESLHPLARKLINNFGIFEEVREEFSSNLCSFSSCGSRAPYYQRRIDALKELIEHPIMEVREWAKSNIKWFEKERDNATRESEEWEWGIR